MVSPGTLALSITRGIEFAGAVLQCRDDSVAITGTGDPAASGTYVPCGTYAAFPLFILAGLPAWFCYYNPTATSYVIAGLLTNGALTDYWAPAAPLTEPTGTYIAHGAYSGSPTATDNPVDLTGFTAEAKVRRTSNPNADLYIDLNPSITDPTGGEITIPPMTTAQTLALQFVGDFKWDLVLVSGGQRFGPFVKGPFTVSDNITQE